MAEEKQMQVRKEERQPAPIEQHWESPLTMMRRMREDIDRMFETFGFGSMLAPWERMFGAPAMAETWAPACDVWETDSDIKVRCDLPGVDPTDIEIHTTHDLLRIHAEMKHEEEEEQRGVHRAERRYGTFHREFSLPENVKSDQVKAVFRHGTVEITMPKTEESRQKMRKVQLETAEQDTAGSKAGKKETKKK
jgi:HSP20 family protein